MIRITDMSGSPLYLNCDLIEKIETVPDTLLVLVNGHRYMVRENAGQVIERLEAFKQRCQELDDRPAWYRRQLINRKIKNHQATTSG